MCVYACVCCVHRSDVSVGAGVEGLFCWFFSHNVCIHGYPTISFILLDAKPHIALLVRLSVASQPPHSNGNHCHQGENSARVRFCRINTLHSTTKEPELGFIAEGFPRCFLDVEAEGVFVR